MSFELDQTFKKIQIISIPYIYGLFISKVK